MKHVWWGWAGSDVGRPQLLSLGAEEQGVFSLGVSVPKKPTARAVGGRRHKFHLQGQTSLFPSCSPS